MGRVFFFSSFGQTAGLDFFFFFLYVFFVKFSDFRYGNVCGLKFVL